MGTRGRRQGRADGTSKVTHLTPEGRRRRAYRWAAQERKWASMAGPVTVRRIGEPPADSSDETLPSA